MAPAAVGVAFTETVLVAVHKVVELVKVKVTEPTVIPDTKPALVTLATAGLLLVQVPPDDGPTFIVLPTQTLDGPDKIGGTLTVIVLVAVHPVEEDVNVRTTAPEALPVISPALVTEATDGLLLVHVPPVEGLTFAVLPTQTEVAPLNTGKAFIVKVVDAVHPVEVCVKVKVTTPLVSPLANPLLFMVATAGLLLDHVPAPEDVKLAVPPTQIDEGPLSTGILFTVITRVDVHPVEV